VAEDFEEDEASGGLGSDSTGKEPKRPSVELDTVKVNKERTPNPPQKRGVEYLDQ